MRCLHRQLLLGLLLVFTICNASIVSAQYDVSLSKSTNALGITDYGILVPFNIRVLNEGVDPVKNISVVDYIPSGYEYLVADNPLWTYNMANSTATFTISDTLYMGEEALVTINLRPRASEDADNWINGAEIFAVQDINGNPVNSSQDNDSNFNMIQGDDDGEDDYDSAFVPIYDLALRKTAVTPDNTYSYGDDITFNIKVFNQGNIEAHQVHVRDFKPEGYIFNASDNADWIEDGSTPYYIFPSPIAPGDSAEVTIDLEITNVFDDGNAWVNYAGIDSAFRADGTPLRFDADSDPATNSTRENRVMPGDNNDDEINGGGIAANEDEDDHDPAVVEVFDFALTKIKVTGPESYSYLQTVNFRNVIHNQGNQEADTVKIVDYIPCGFNFLEGLNPDWSYDPGTRQATYAIDNPPAPNMTTHVDIVLIAQPCYDDPYSAWFNYAEIAEVIDTSGSPRADIDSSADTNPDNDAGGEPYTPTDNQLDGIGIIDEDDHDPRTIQIVDFALKKTIVSPDTVVYGEPVRFSIKGYNQGNVTLEDVLILDDIPSGYTYVPANNPGWSSNLNEPQYTYPGRIAPGDSVEVFLDLILNQTTMEECEWVNYGQLVQLRDTLSTRDDDADSFSFFETDAENSVKPGDPDDDNIFANGPNAGEDQDDHDPAGPEIFDIALSKDRVPGQTYGYDQLIEFKITLYNQGNLDADTVVVMDYLPEGYSFDPADQTENWTIDPDTGNPTISWTTDLAARTDTSFSIFLTLECVPASIEAWTNAAEITRAVDENGNDYDTDSTPDNDPDNDLGGNPDSDEDNLVDDSGTDVDGDGVVDEDDHDSDRTQVVDLALKKELSTPPPYSFGQNVVFDITVYNQGNVAVQNIDIADYIAPGYSFDDNIPANAGWGETANGAVYTITDRLDIGDSTTVRITLQFIQPVVKSGLSDFINFAELTGYQDTLGNEVAMDDYDSMPGSDSAAERSVELGSDEDDDTAAKDKGGNEDDHDPAGILIYDVALDKQIVSQTPYKYGDTLEYEIAVWNEGTQPATNIEVEDVLGCGLLFVSTNEPLWSYDVGSATASTIITDTLQCGDTTRLTILVELEYCDETFSSDTYNNVAQVTEAEDDNGDPGDDGDSTPDNDDPSEDDQDDEPISVYDLALIKDVLSSPAGIMEGSLVDFQFTVYNQGNATVRNIQVVDDVPSAYTFEEADNTGWIASGDDALFVVGELAPQEDTSIVISLRFTPSEGSDVVNYGELGSFDDEEDNDITDEDADSTPNNNTDPETRETPDGPGDGDITSDGTDGIEDDNDPAILSFFDLSLDKSLQSDVSDLSYGDDVVFEIEVRNEGTLPAINTEVRDDLPCGLLYQSVNDGDWVYDSGDGSATAVITDTLYPGETYTLSLILTLEYCDDSDAYTNTAQITDDETPGDDDPQDNDSEPDNDDPDEDDQDDEFFPVVDLALTKTVADAASLTLGSDVTFDIEVFNQSNIDYDSVEIMDYIPSGFTLNDPNWVASGNTATYIHRDQLLSGESFIVSIVLSMAAGDDLSDYYNYAEVIAAYDTSSVDVASDDVDSTPGSDSAYERAVTPTSSFDDEVLGQGAGELEDEDDHDVAGVDPFGSIGDFVWQDLDDDGVQDPNEPGIEGVNVYLRDCQGVVIAQTTTDANGNYTFNNVLAGEYSLLFEVPDQSGFVFTDQGVGGEAEDSDALPDGSTECFTLEVNEDNTDVDAGLTGLADIGDYVWEDVDGDGIQDPGEPGIPGVEVVLYNESGNPVAVTTTDNNGFYTFENRGVGTYTLGFTPADEDFEPTTPFAGNSENDSNINEDGRTPDFNLMANSDDLSQDAGFYRCATICGFTWYDVDEDDYRDNGENGLNGLEINFYRLGNNGAELVAQTYAGADPNSPSGDGWFTMCLRPGQYYIEVPLPPYGLVSAVPFVGGDPSRDSDLGNFNGPSTSPTFTVQSGSTKCDLGAGFYPMATLGDRAWIDQNNDGLRSPSEPAVANILVEVFDTQDTKIDEAYTNQQGRYTIDYLGKDSYYLRFTPPAGYHSTQPLADPQFPDKDSDVDHSNGINTTRLIETSPGEHTGDVDAGFAFGVLPVVWKSVAVEAIDGDHVITWSTSLELNTSHYEVERQIANGRFHTLEEMPAQGEAADYRYNDTDVTQNSLYTYRIKQVDLDGTVSYSERVYISAKGHSSASLYPNPASQATRLVLTGISQSEVSITMIDPLGQQVRTWKRSTAEGNLDLDIDVDQMAAGIYTIRVDYGDQFLHRKLMVVR